jgi:hypothetical protein
MASTAAGGDRQQRLLNDITALSDRVRELRRVDASANGAQIKTLEVQTREKWQELRIVRAGPTDVDTSSPRSRGFYH